MTEPQPMQQPTIQPQPAPEQWKSDVLSNGMVQITIFSVTGSHVSFMDGAIAVQLGEQIANAGRQAQGGLIIAPPGIQLPPPPFNGNGHRT